MESPNVINYAAGGVQTKVVSVVKDIFYWSIKDD